MSKTKKIISLTLIFFTAISFSGCINLSKKEAKKNVIVNRDQGIFKSVDGGRTWEQKVSVEGGGFIDGVKISSMAMDPKNNNTLYLGTVGNGLYKSENGADSWKKITDENNILSGSATVYDIAIERKNPDIVYIAVLNNGQGQLMKSINGGESWESSYIVSERGKAVYAVEIDPIFQNTVFIGTAQSGFLRSDNKGREWKTIYWFDNEVIDIIVDSWNSNGIFVRTPSAIFKSVNRGRTWNSIGENINADINGINLAKINSVTMHPDNPLVIYITYQNLVLVTRDGGYRWQKLNTITPSKTAVGTIPQVKQIGLIRNIVYYGAGNVLYKSEDSGSRWSSYNIPIRGDVRYTVSDYTNSDVIYVGAFYEPPPSPEPTPGKKKRKSLLFNPFGNK